MGREYTSQEESAIVSKVIIVEIETSFSNHIYELMGNLYLQLAGGAIGVRLTGEVARIIMDRWAKDVRASLSRSKLEVYHLSKYVDEVDVATSLIPKG